MLINIISAFISVSLLGGLLGIGLAFAAKKLAVKKDERVLTVEDTLPGINCGACGFAGCSAYAEAIVVENADIGLCSPGGKETAEKLSSIMGIEIEFNENKLVAKVHCNGNREHTEYSYSYKGVEDCNAAVILFKGDKACKYGCLGLGSCIKVCPVDAIKKTPDGRVAVDKEICISCKKCVGICPTGVMQMIPYEADYFVACNSKDKGGIVRKICKVGCIGCKICEKKFPEAGFEVNNFLSVVNYESAGTDREGAAEACPTNSICKIN